jgi:hypothetical protein
VQICQTNYQKDLLEWVAPENLPEWLGGTSKGTLLDDCGPWSDPEVLRRMEGQLPVACKALKRMATLSGTGEVVLQLEDGEGYHSPRCVCGSCFVTMSLLYCATESVCRHGWMPVLGSPARSCNAIISKHYAKPVQLVPSHAAAVCFCCRRSEASFVSISSSTAPSEPLLSHAGSGAWVPGSGPARSSLSATEDAGIGEATPGGEASSSVQQHGSMLTIAAINAHK